MKLFLFILVVGLLSSNNLFALENENLDTEQKVTEEKVIAQVNGQPILLSELKEKLKLAERSGQILLIKEEKQRVEENILEQMIEEAILLQEAWKSKIEVTPEDLEPAKKELMIMQLIDFAVRAKIEVTKREIKDFYSGNKLQFQSPEKVKISYLVVAVSSRATEQEWFNAETKALEALVKLRQVNSFLETAEEISGKEEGVHLIKNVLFETLSLAPPLREAIARLKESEISFPIKIPFGFQIMRLESRQPPRQESLEEVKEEIKQILYEEKMREEYKKWLLRLKKKAVIERYL